MNYRVAFWFFLANIFAYCCGMTWNIAKLPESPLALVVVMFAVFGGMCAVMVGASYGRED